MFLLLLIFQLRFISIQAAISSSTLSCDPWEAQAGSGERGPAGLSKGSHWDCRADGPINCPSSTNCNVYCEEDISNSRRRRRSLLNIDNEACAGVTINCPSNAICNIHCTYSCKGMKVNAQLSTALNILNCGTVTDACNDMTVLCPIHNGNGNGNGNTCKISGSTDKSINNLNISAQEAFYDIDLSTIDLKDGSTSNIINCGLNTNDHECVIDPTSNNQCSPINGVCTNFKLTDSPTSIPTQTPTLYPSYSPSRNPTFNPSLTPSKTPSKTPTETPSKHPTNIPSKYPSQQPTEMPSISTEIPTEMPTKTPTEMPTKTPTEIPTKTPTEMPTKNPSMIPTEMPTKYPSKQPTNNPIANTNMAQAAQNEDDSIYSNTMMTVVIVCGVAGIVLLICCILFCFYYRKRKQKYKFKTDETRQKNKNMHALDHTIPVTPQQFPHRVVPTKSFTDGKQLLTEMVLSEKPHVKSIESDDDNMMANYTNQSTVGFENIENDEFIVTQKETDGNKINHGERDGEGSNTDNEYDTGTEDEGTSNSDTGNDMNTKGFINDVSDDDDYVVDDTIQ